MNHRIFIDVVGFFVLTGVLVTMRTQVDLGGVRAGGTDTLVTCGDLSAAANADQDDKVFGIVGDVIGDLRGSLLT